VGTQTKRRFCKDEQRYVLATRQTPNHILHLLLALVTVGIWIIPWFFISLSSNLKPYRCPTCGSTTSARGTAKALSV